MAIKPSQKTLREFVQLLGKERQVIDDILAFLPRIARVGDNITVYRAKEPLLKWLNLMVLQWRKLDGLGLGDADKAKCLRWLQETLSDPALQKTLKDDVWSALLYRMEKWDPETIGRLYQMRKKLVDSGRGDEATDIFKWLLRRECGANPGSELVHATDETKKLISIDMLVGHHPAFRGDPLDPAAIRRARGEVESLMGWSNSDFKLPARFMSKENAAAAASGKSIDSTLYGRALEDAHLDRMKTAGQLDPLDGFKFKPGMEGLLDGIDLSARRGRKASESVGDSTSGKRYSGNFPHIDMVFKEGGRKFGQITHGEPAHLVNKYMRLIGMVDRKLAGAETQAVENLRHMGFLKGKFTEALADMRRKSYLFVPENQVAGLKVLVSGHPAFKQGIERLGWSVDEALGRIRAIPAFGK